MHAACLTLVALGPSFVLKKTGGCVRVSALAFCWDKGRSDGGCGAEVVWYGRAMYDGMY